MGIFLLVSQPMAGIVALVLAAVLLPPVNKLVEDKLNFSLSGGLKFVVVIILFVVMIIFAGRDAQNRVEEVVEQHQQEQTGSANEETATEEARATIGERNALRQAESYLAISGFSRSGLIEQLEFEGYSRQEATYAVDNVGADWNEQAARKAESYLDVSAFSRAGLIEQLEFEGFTRQQAEYGATAVGY